MKQRKHLTPEQVEAFYVNLKEWLRQGTKFQDIFLTDVELPQQQFSVVVSDALLRDYAGDVDVADEKILRTLMQAVASQARMNCSDDQAFLVVSKRITVSSGRALTAFMSGIECSIHLGYRIVK